MSEEEVEQAANDFVAALGKDCSVEDYVNRLEVASSNIDAALAAAREDLERQQRG